MSWKKKIAIGFGSLIGLLAVAAIGLWIWKPWVPPVEMTDPGPAGRRIAADGLLANYFPGTGTGKRPAILVLGGSEGGLGKAATRESQALAAQGYAVLQLAYFRSPGQPKPLELLPLELFTHGLDWLKAQPEVDGSRIAVVGGSKGAEAALLVASRHPELKAVVAGMPSSVVWAGFSWETFGSKVSSWTEAGKPVSFLPLGSFDRKQGVISVYVGGLAQLATHADAIIPIERTSAPVLLLCGEKDELWPSCAMARQVEARAKQFGHPAVTVLAYADAGHAVMGLPRQPGDPDIAKLGSMGGSGEGNNAARADGWPKVLGFLKAALNP